MLSCGGGSEDPKPDPIPEPENRAPAKPIILAPGNNSECIDNAVLFEWNKTSDPDGDAISYVLEVANNNSFSPILHLKTVINNSESISLEKGQFYYWRVKAVDNHGLYSEYSSIFSLYTEGEAVENHLPFSPNLVSPSMNETILTNTVQLEWEASDIDVNDVLSFDIFFGTLNPPNEIIESNYSETKKEVTLKSSTSYYWKVVVKDGSGGEVEGPIWTFKTD